MAYTLTFVDGVWYINGAKLFIPRDTTAQPVCILAGIDPSGNIVPIKVDTDGTVFTKTA